MHPYHNSSVSRGMVHCNTSAHGVPLSDFLVVLTSHSSTFLYALASPIRFACQQCIKQMQGPEH